MCMCVCVVFECVFGCINIEKYLMFFIHVVAEALFH